MNDFYVYKHITKDTGEVFYIGKGRGRRAFNLKHRSTFHKNIVAKHGVVVVIAAEGLTEESAYNQEKELIKSFRAIGLCRANIMDGGEGRSTGFKLSADSKEKCRLAATGIVQTEESKQKKAKSVSAYHQANAKPFYVLKDGELIGSWTNQHVCAEDLGLFQANISKCLSGERKSSGGFTFRWNDV